MLSVRETVRCRPTNARYRATINNGDITSFKVGGIDPHGLKMDQQRKLPRILMVLTYAVATLDAVAASEFDLTGEPYDLIIRVSLQKPAWMRRTYWPEPARHYSKAGNDTRASHQVDRSSFAPKFRNAHFSR